MSSPIKVLQDYIFTSKYARWIEDKQRRETWVEAVSRVENMMLTKYQDRGVDDDIKWAYDMMRKKRVLGSQRALQYGGESALKKEARVFNCCASYCDRPRFFQEYFWLLLCGCGAGFSVQSHHIAKLPKIVKNYPRKSPWKTFVIPDTIEGWADSVGVLITWALGVQPGMEKFAEFAECDSVVFDYSKIRPKGAILSSGVGKAPGPEGLKRALEKIKDIFLTAIDNDQDKLTSIQIYDICMHISDAVLSGGVRRSATIVLFSHDDKDMLNAKTGNWLAENPQRQRSNNSVVLIRKNTSKEQFKEIIDSIKQFGEPGFYFADSPEALANPCNEIQFFCYDIIDEKLFLEWKEGHAEEAITCDPSKIGLKSGWEMCNLSTTNCASLKGETKEEKIAFFLDNIRAAAILGTLQAGFNKFEYLGETSENICKREALLGVSMTGMMDNPDIVLDPKIQREAVRIIKLTNKQIASKIGINRAARFTALKPEGTGSLVLGTLACGIHCHHYIKYLRAVQANVEEDVYKFFKQKNPQACEPYFYSASKNDDVIYFPIEVPDGAKTKNKLPALEMLEMVKSTMQNWVYPGKNAENCVMPWIKNNVSNTITVKPDEWEAVSDFIFENKKYFTGLTLLGISGDKDYPQAPFCAVYSSRQIVREYGEAALWTSGLIELGLKAFNGLYMACDAILKSDYDPLNDLNKNDEDDLITASHRRCFVKKSHRFANKYFNGDFKKLTYCMKDVFNWKRWYDLNNSFKEVDYTELVEVEDNTAPEQEIACAGGACSLV